MTAFRTQWGNAMKPGSVCADGGVIDYLGQYSERGPCFVPRDFGCTSEWNRRSRICLLGRRGWNYTTAKDWPAIAPSRDVVCIDRVPPERPRR